MTCITLGVLRNSDTVEMMQSDEQDDENEDHSDAPCKSKADVRNERKKQKVRLF